MIQQNNIFTSWELLPDETAMGYTLTPEQCAVIQNDIADAATRRLSLKFDTNNPQAFIQEEAYLKGKIETLRYMLLRSRDAATIIADSINNAAPSA